MSRARLRDLLTSRHLPPPVEPGSRLPSQYAEELQRLVGLEVYPRSVRRVDRSLFFLASERAACKYLCIIGDTKYPGFEGSTEALNIEGARVCLQRCPADEENSIALRQALPFTSPGLVGLRKSIGLGDRLGVATPGHVRAVRGRRMTPVFAQQSIREMQRTRRGPRAVIADACWGVFQEGWTDGFGADADHLKTAADIDACVEAGFTMFTIDPSDHVAEPTPGGVAESELQEMVETLPWETLEIGPADLERRYMAGRPAAEHVYLEIDRATFLRTAIKYGRAVAHIVRLYRHLEGRMGTRPFELELSLDETESPTTMFEHFFVASELSRLGIRWVSLAPRFPGRFEKGVDYLDDLAAFERSVAGHAALSRALGPYKISVHSGSDKFTLYPVIARHVGDLVHVKTAGTSYLEALRVVAARDPELFRRILALALEKYPADRTSYYVSADPEAVADPRQYDDDELGGLLNNPGVRQILHVTYGSVLTACGEGGSPQLRDRILGLLHSYEEDYYTALERHLALHVVPFDT